VSNVRLSKEKVFTLLLFGMVILLTGIVCADQPEPAVPETQTLSTVTTADVVGIAMETDAATWSVASGGIPLSGNDPMLVNFPGWGDGSTGHNNYTQFLDGWNFWLQYYPDGTFRDFLNYVLNHRPDDVEQAQALITWLNSQGSLHDPPIYDGEVRYTTAYDASIIAQGGHTVVTKSMNIDTRNKVIGQSNLNAQTVLAFAATGDGGNIVGSENLMLDGAGNTTIASDRMLCPFAAYPVDVIPAYCNIVQAGSRFDLTIGSVTTNANDRFVGTDATNPVVLNYDITVKPYSTSQGQIPAMGSSMAYIKAHIQEGRGFNITRIELGEGYELITGTPVKAEDLTYSEQSSAQGTITAFNKVMTYQSGRSLLP
jgi:hypothetical protein